MDSLKTLLFKKRPINLVIILKNGSVIYSVAVVTVNNAGQLKPRVSRSHSKVIQIRFNGPYIDIMCIPMTGFCSALLATLCVIIKIYVCL